MLLERWAPSSHSPLTYSLWLADANGTNPKALVPQVEGQVRHRRLVVARRLDDRVHPVRVARDPDENGRVPNTCAVYTVDERRQPG